MIRNFFHEWINNLSDESVIYLINELWGENEFTNSNIDYLKTCFKKSKRVYEYYLTYILIGD
jgi:hypothetical protein